MRNKLMYFFANMALISSVPVVLFLALAGVEVVFSLGSLWGFVFMMISAGHIMACSVSMAIHIKQAFNESK